MIQLALLPLLSASAPAPDTSVAQPVVAFFIYQAFGTERIFWNSAPRFVLYRDGRIIYRTSKPGAEAAFEAVQLSGPETAALLDSLKLQPVFFSP